MTDNKHPITPPPKLVQQLADGPGTWLEKIVNAYLAGADQELEACCDWLQDPDLNVDTYKLRAARRPKPPSLKEQALQELERVVTLLMPVTGPNKVERFAIIRRALEQLDD